MKRFHVHVGVENLDTSIAFYSGLFGQAPSVTKPDYAKWMLEDPRINFAISTKAPIERFRAHAQTRGWRHARHGFGPLALRQTIPHSAAYRRQLDLSGAIECHSVSALLTSMERQSPTTGSQPHGTTRARSYSP